MTDRIMWAIHKDENDKFELAFKSLTKDEAKALLLTLDSLQRKRDANG